MSEIALLSALAAGEHAAVFGFGVLGARLDPRTRALAQRAADSHRVRRDLVIAQLRQRSAPVPGSLAGYDVAVADRPAALALAVALEEGMALRWCDLVGGTVDQSLRGLGVAGLQEAAVRAAVWREIAGAPAVTVALPGLSG